MTTAHPVAGDNGRRARPPTTRDAAARARISAARARPTEGCSIKITRSDTGYRYQIILRGECRSLLAGLVGDAVVECGHGRTCVTASVRDDSELYGLLDRFQDVALHLVSLREVSDSADTAS